MKISKLATSTRPEKKVGDDATWDQAEQALEEALKAFGYKYHLNEGDGAFYGPKIDVQISDAIGRYFQLGTVQLDFQLPDRFDLKFTNKNGEEEERPVVVHRALLGSIERFFGIYLEHVAGAFPFWIAPEQAVIVPVNNEFHLEHATALKEKLMKLGFRVRLDDKMNHLVKRLEKLKKQKFHL